MSVAQRHDLPPAATAVDVVAMIDNHELNSRGLGHAAHLLEDLRTVLEAGPRPEVPDVTRTLGHVGNQLVMLEYDGFGLYCPECGRKD
jgi:hypothetical protein